jgi:hypothetical protein
MNLSAIMKLVNIYIVTYKNKERINENYIRFLQTTHNVRARNEAFFTYTIINNHSDFDLIQAHPGKNCNQYIWHNTMRPDHSCGHLSRDYNAAFINGFVDLKNPACDQIICGHDDIWYHDNWFEKLTEIHQTYDFYAGDYGCSMTSYLPSAVKTIGMWDERLCNIGYHEADFYLRARLYNPDKSTINDYFGGRVWNPTEVLFDHPPENAAKLDHSNKSLRYHTVSRKIFDAKWGCHPEQWATRWTTTEKTPRIPTFMNYPYFECDIDNLEEKGYIYAKPGLEHFLEEWK